FRPTDENNEDGDYARYIMSRQTGVTPGSTAAEDANSLIVRARFPGSLGNLRVRLTLSLGQNMLGEETIIDPATGLKVPIRTAKSLLDDDIVWVSGISSPISSAGLASPIGQIGEFYQARSYFNAATQLIDWAFYDSAGNRAFTLQDLSLGVGSPLGI